MTWRPCPCKRWGDCPGYQDYQLSDIQLCRVQVIFLLKPEVEFVTEDSPGSRRIKPHASFTAVSDLWAELEYRLKATKRDGQTLQHEIGILGVYDYKSLSPAARDALNYISGNKRKFLKYNDWLSQRNRRNKVKEGVML